MSEFQKKLLALYNLNYFNNYGKENHDHHRFGPYIEPTFSERLSYIIEKIKLKTIFSHRKMWIFDGWKNKYGNDLAYIYENLNQASRSTLLNVILYRMLGNKKVKLPENNDKYWENIKVIENLKCDGNNIQIDSCNITLNMFDLKKIGYDLKLYFEKCGVAIDFLNEQYKYEDSKNIIEVEKNDVVFDLGGCWGDTALYFASKTGIDGEVHTFEFIPNNLKILKKNIS